MLVMDESETNAITSELGADDYDEETVEVRPKETVTRDLKVRAVK